ncbi:MAG: aminopeptidase P family protein [Dehalococcoidia bacterium]|nr:aminopeptidase P family protein [Dehalococcoidia bacterium]
MNTAMRLQKLRNSLSEKNVTALLVTQPENRFYLSGFYGSAGYLLITADKALLATDSRYVEQAGRQAPNYQLFESKNDLHKWLPEFLCGLALKELAFEAESLSFWHYSQIKNIVKPLGIALVPVNGLVENLRTGKDDDELALIKKAVSLSDAAIEHMRNTMHIGMSELEMAWEIEKHMREHGSETLPFEVIVAAGCNAAIPHHHPCDYIIKENEPIIIDIGAKCGGYISDLTRTLFLGQEDAQFHLVYNTVLQAQTAAIENIRAGMSGSEADRMARSVIDANGFGDKFGHGLGHGIGLAVHEAPRIGAISKDILQNGMTFTIEPGIYLPGWGGVRIEDSVVLENGRIKTLSTAGK